MPWPPRPSSGAPVRPGRPGDEGGRDISRPVLPVPMDPGGDRTADAAPEAAVEPTPPPPAPTSEAPSPDPPEGTTGDPAESATGAPPGPPPPSAEEEEWKTRYRYLLAEFDNYRKRTDREREKIRRETRALLLRELLPLHDAFDRADEAARRRPAEDPLRRGMELLVKEWERFLESEQVAPVARVGEPFRAEEEEAVGEVRTGTHCPEGSVAEVIQQGFRSPGGLLRPAKVLIARPLSARPSSGTDGASAEPDEGNGSE